jgi:hypothetical protein
LQIYTVENIPLADFTFVPGANVGFHMERWWFGAMSGVQLGLRASVFSLGFYAGKMRLANPGMEYDGMQEPDWCEHVSLVRHFVVLDVDAACSAWFFSSLWKITWTHFDAVWL